MLKSLMVPAAITFNRSMPAEAQKARHAVDMKGIPMDHILSGISQGFLVANAALETEKQRKLFCMPDNLDLEPVQARTVLGDYGNWPNSTRSSVRLTG